MIEFNIDDTEENADWIKAGYDDTKTVVAKRDNDGTQLRDAYGRFAYHGGAGAELLASVRKNGLQPGAEWFGRDPAVYLSAQPDTAANYAVKRAVSVLKGGEENIIGFLFKVRTPKDVQMDTKQSRLSYMVNHAIKPEDIVSYQMFKVSVKDAVKSPSPERLMLNAFGKWMPLKKEEGISYCCAVIIEGGAEYVQKFNPNHDEKGRFATAPGHKEVFNLEMQRSPLGNAFALMAVTQANKIPEDEPVQSLLGKIIDATNKDGVWPRMEFVHTQGKELEVLGSDDIREQHRCYNNSLDILMESWGTGRQVEYVEGYVTEHGVPLAHAWNKEGDRYIDHTVPDPWKHQYIGLLIPRKVLMPVATSSHFGKGYGEGIIGSILTMKNKKKRDEYLRLIREANQ